MLAQDVMHLCMVAALNMTTRWQPWSFLLSLLTLTVFDRLGSSSFWGRVTGCTSLALIISKYDPMYI